MSKVPVGAVLVVGSGIGGMQASIDLADSGFKVYLVERDSAIGGRMSMLDKTFPTNDCSMCIISPKLIDVGRHPNIEILTNTNIQTIGGDPGNFMVRLHQNSRNIDLEKCTGCGDCAKACPVAVPNSYNMERNERYAAYKRYPQAIPGGYCIEKRGTSPCRDACPAHVSAQGYVALIAEGRFDDAIRSERLANPFPSVCGRVCPHPCEDACNRSDVEEAVAICDLKRFIADYEKTTHGKPVLPTPAEDTGKKIAVVGGGPSGLTAAYYTRLAGHQVTVYEQNEKAGGMLRYGIPDYRLPQDILDFEISGFEALGIDIKLKTKIGDSIKMSDLREQFDAVYLASGAPLSNKLPVPGEDLDGVSYAVDLLDQVNKGGKPAVGQKVAIIGGGHAAVDCGGAVVRLGGKLTHQIELIDKMHEIDEPGIKCMPSTMPIEVLGKDGKVVGMRLRKVNMSEPDENGRRVPIPVENSEFEIECDQVVVAIGQSADPDYLKEGEFGNIVDRRWLKVNPVTFQTDIPGLFAGGDAAKPDIAVAAIGAGKEAAESINRFLAGMSLTEGREWNPVIATPPDIDKVEKEPRRRPSELPRSKTIGNFDEVVQVFSEEEAIAEAKRCLSCGLCSECFMCVEACKADAVDHSIPDKNWEVEVGSIILAPGFDQFDAGIISEYGYGRWDNVVTSLEFERFLSATGPSTGHLVRPSDHADPKRVAWIQCVASRDQRRDRDFCSGVCCMFATKEAVIATDHAGGKDNLETTIFYMDLRAMGKGFDEYVERAKSNYGVRYVRSMISRVDEIPGSKNIAVTYIDDDGNQKVEEFDMLVLSTGLKPAAGVKELAGMLDVELDKYGFAKTDTFSPVSTSRPGVFVCGVFEGPKDIPETVAQASGAAAVAARDIATARGTLITKPDLPPERDVEGEDPRVGVFVCRCGINIASVVDVPGVAEYAEDLEGVVYSSEALFACSQDNQQKIKEVIDEHKLNRLVVASCTPRTHEPVFQQTIREAGINSYLFSMANIREQCSWVHPDRPAEATDKAKDLVRMAVANARHLKPLHKQPQTLVQAGLVVGGGLAGMTAALELASQGFQVSLVERSDRLGGNASNSRFTFELDLTGPKLQQMISTVENHPLIDVYYNSEVERQSGFLGNFETDIRTGGEGGRLQTIMHGATVIATGAQEWKPDILGYGESEKVVTHSELQRRIADDPGSLGDAGDVVMIQCVGSRIPERPYCSKVCCTQALVNALKLKDLNPERNVTIVMREMRSYGLKEKLYTEARRRGVRFVRYEVEDMPVVTVDGDSVMVEVNEPGGATYKLKTDVLSLAAAIVANDQHKISELLKLPRTNDNFFLEVHQKLRPVEFASDGIFLAGLAHGPKPIDETIAQAAAAASRASTILSKTEMMVGGVVSVVDPDKCAVCLCCVRACPYGVPEIKDELDSAYINPAECQGCGICASECPGKAIQLQQYTDEQICSMTAEIQKD